LHSHDLFNMNKGVSGSLLLKDWSQILTPFANVFWQKTKNFTNLKKVLESIFNFKFEIDQFQEKKILVESECQASLKNCKLSNKILGKYATSVQNKISISVFIDNLQDYLIIVLNKNHLDFIFKIVDYYMPSFISVSYKFFLNPASKPACYLNGSLFLNKNAWLGKNHISNYASKG
jgi:predicted component of type VI protein secretion system